MTNEIIQLTKDIANEKGYDKAVLLAFIEVETGGRGFDQNTGKILIQFEPLWFKRKVPFAPSGLWSVNKVDVQGREWEAFNNAFKINQNGAMESTSIGLGQIMGFHFKRLGFSSVGAMWDDAKKGLKNQILQIVKFLETDQRLRTAIRMKDWHTIATIYNGAGYKDLAKKYNREPYDVSLKKAYQKYSI